MKRLANLVPGMAVSDVGDSRFTDPEFRCYISICHSSQMAKANALHLVGRKFLSVATFARSIMHIVLLSSKEYMVGIATRWIVTGMQDIKRVWISPASNQPENSSSHASMIIDSNLSSTVWKRTSGPRPAFLVRACAYFVPESNSLNQSQELKRQWFTGHWRILSTLSM